jgi:hypothetical protein
MSNVSKRDVLNALNTLNFDEVVVGDVTVTPDDFKTFIENSIEALDKKNAAAAKRAAERKATGDELRAEIAGLLGETPKTIPQILAELGRDDVTSAMVVARLGQLVKLGEVFKSDVKVDGGRSVKGYSTVEVVTE